MNETKHKIRYVATIIIDDEWSITVMSNTNVPSEKADMEMIHLPCNTKLEIGIDWNSFVPVYYCPKCNKQLKVTELFEIYGDFFKPFKTKEV